MDQAERAATLIHLLATFGHQAALVGGLAVSVRARERFTRDVDFAVALRSDEEAEKLAHSMQRQGFPLLDVFEQEAKGVVSVLRFRHAEDPGGGPTIDLLCASSGIEPEIVGAATRVPIAGGVLVPVARVPHLIATKVLSETPLRDQDRGDLRALISVASLVELEEAREAVALIEERGFHRGRNLRAALDRFVTEMRLPEV